MPTRLAEIADFDRYGQPSAWTSRADATTKNRHLEMASAKVLSYLQQRHKLPLVSWGDDVRGATIDIARASLALFIGVGAVGGDDAYAKLEAAAQAAVAWLRDVSSGKATLVDVVDSSSPQPADGGVVDDVLMVMTSEPRGW